MAEGGSEGVLCRYFLSGVCRDGRRCLFSHDRSTGQVDNVCRYYLKGECIYGTRCRYDHIRTKPRADSTTRSGRGSRGTNQGNRSQISPPEAATPACSSSVSRGPHTGPLTVLKKNNNESSWSGDPTCKTVHSSSWADAPEFVPKSGLPARASKSYASIVRPEGSAEKAPPSKEASLPLCPYEVASDGCPVGANCTYLHGELCDLCQKPCLHPYNEEQRSQHREECVQRHEQDMELSFAIQRSADKCCGICMDVVMDKEPASERRFGILEKCSHIFCLNCIRKWRGSKQFDSKTVRACPECRVPSDFVTPSSFWVDMGDEKDKLIADYKSAMSAKPCRYFQEGRGECPFAGACFYKHMYPDGRKAVMPPPRPRRRQNHNGDLEIMERLYLWDFLDVADSHMFAPFNLEDVFEILSETEDSDSDWSDIDILLN
ncbi:E3 ubiquitin-protein ligase makorin-1-like isoform X1 [Dermacentor andersoni]|uniref:E3 ubiquitin-protein ligase makorin-1-like isoform X1 n=1 Tax=Dermacentor andersoni TaxID=34620 RepID=UPI0021555CBD|nr:probable E3 ubiquitin-protein ligase makorin-1 isoform X1 [Dermacentor andersoni]